MSAQIAARCVALELALIAPLAVAQEFYRCTSADGKVTYQQSACPTASEQRKVDATPANTDFDTSGRERLLKQGDEAGKRLVARAAEEEAERRRRQEQRERDEQLEREAVAREEARTVPEYIYGSPPIYPIYPPRPRPPVPPRPRPTT